LRDEIEKYLNECKSFEVKYDDNGNPLITDYRGISKGTIDKDKSVSKILRRRRRRRRVPKKIVEIVRLISFKLLSEKIKHRVIFGNKDVMIYLDFDHFIHIYPDKITIAGFNSLEEAPLIYLREILENYGPVKLLRPLR